jgi:hypothetical protein
MPKQVVLKTTKNKASVNTYLNSIEDENSRRDAKALLKIFKQASGAKATMWGGSIIGFGEYRYARANGDEGRFMATGFAIRKSGPVLYIMPGYQDYSEIMQRLGKHKLGKSCLYLKRLSDIDTDVLRELIHLGLEDLGKKYDVKI